MKDTWVFGYGSLLWNTGFEYRDVTPARVQGYHRALCVYSHVYRGSKERPGLVCGLLRGGACRGLAFRVPAEQWDSVRNYLHEREMIYDVYVPKWVNARLGPGFNETDKVYTFVANARHDQYAGRLSIDEMPQLWLVFTGDLSLVGPRPPVPSEVDRYSIDDRRRLDVTPGLTCIWQVSGRSTIPFEQQVQLDVAYIESQSLWLDLVLLARTIPAVLSGRGAF